MSHPRIVMVLLVGGLSLLSRLSAQASFSDLEVKNLGVWAAMSRKDLRAEKRAIIADSIGLDPKLETRFWAVYDKYESEFKALWDQRLANTKKYAARYENMTDAIADEMAQTLLKNDRTCDSLKLKYYARFKAAVGARLATRFLHVESALDRLIELQVLAILPLVP